MRFIGGKTLMLDNIIEVIKNKTNNVKSILDPFAGSNAVSHRLKKEGYKVSSNDIMYFSYVLSKGELTLNKKPIFAKLGIEKPIDYLNSLTLDQTNFTLDQCFIYNNYSPNEHCERMYFQNKNAIKIDIIRLTIEMWKNENRITESEYFYLLACLINAVPFVANITGTYGAYLKYWDVRTFNDIVLEEPILNKSKFKCNSYNEDANDLVKKLKCDLLYLDTPYNQRQYTPNYHLLETIAKYDYPTIKGVTGIRDYENQKSDFCIKEKVYESFYRILASCKSRYALISYNNEGLLSSKELEALCRQFAKEDTFQLLEYNYRRYKNKIPNNTEGLKEQLYFFEFKDPILYKSPLNYIGGKYRLLPQLLPIFPKQINKFYDVFSGGLDVSLNVNAKEYYCNDINSCLIDMFKKMQESKEKELIETIGTTISKWGLNKEDKEAFLKFRDYYNNYKNPIDLFILICYSFNFQIRFNNDLKFNTPFGKNKSYFNEKIKSNLINFIERIKSFNFLNLDFKQLDFSSFDNDDFLYFDPPYLITCGTYNDGKRGFTGWGKEEEESLLKLLDELNEKKIKFALSNVVKHKGRTNEILEQWMKKYKIHYLNIDYNNSNYQSKNKDLTVEVLITNY